MINKKRGFFGVLWIAALCHAGASCVTNNESIFIHNAIVPDPQDKCSIKADTARGALLAGTVDVNLTSAYVQFFLVGNEMVPRGDPARLRPETSKVQFTQADVQIFDGETVVDDFSVPITGFVDEANETLPSYGVVEVDPLITTTTLKGITTAHKGGGVFVVARVRIRGVTLGGLKVRTGPYDFPVFVCAGCLKGFAPQSCDDTINAACVFGQDVQPDCREVAKCTNVACSTSAGEKCTVGDLKQGAPCKG